MTDQTLTLKTFRWVRSIIVAMTIGLLISFLYEVHRAEGCTLNSLSAYYYTPARGLFTGGLIAIGVCLIALRDADDVKDSLLNFAGLFGPLVALVPTELTTTVVSMDGSTRDTREAMCIKAGRHGEAGDAFQLVTAGRGDSISNNFFSLMALLIAGLAALAVLIYLARRKPANSSHQASDKPSWTPFVFGVVAMTLAIIAYNIPWSQDRMHITSAILLFGLVAIYAILDGQDAIAVQKAKWRGRAYIGFGLAIICGCIAIKVLGEYLDWERTTLWVELWGVVLFLIFWCLQTWDLWNHPTRKAAIEAGQRQDDAPDAALSQDGSGTDETSL